MAKKILITAYDFPPQWGGVATYSSELAAELKNKGFSVTVLTGKGTSELDKEYRVLRVPLANTGLLNLILMWIQLIKLLKKESFDHIFCTLWLPGAASVYLALKTLKKKMPFSISVHAMEIIESNENLKKRLRQKIKPIKLKTFQEASQIFCVSQFTKQLLLNSLPLEADKVYVVNNGVNPNKFHKAEKKLEAFPRLFTACRLIPNKGVDQVIKALPELIKKYPSLSYQVAGSGPDKERLEKLTDMMDVKKYVNFLGKIDHQQLIDEFQKSHLFIMLSRKEKHYVEGFGLVFLEAALCGTPSLGGQSGGISDAIEEGVTGWLVDPYSETAITEKLLEILNHPQELEKISQQAYEKTLSEKTWSHRVQEILKRTGLSC